MKKKIVSLLSAIALTLGATALTGCGNTPPADPSGNPITASVVSSSLLDGKIANLLSAQGVGIQEKVSATSPQLNAQAGALYQDQDEPETQKIQEFAKQTESGIVDIHFHAQTDSKMSYNDFNLQYQTHHHGGVMCIYKICGLVSDEVAQEESTGENTDTVVSLNARVNKLYSTENFTFIAISSAVTGDFTVKSEETRLYPDPSRPAMATNANTFVNMEDHVASGSSPFSYSYIEIPANGTRPKGFIPVKKYDTETGYHTANYWSDDYNQSFIIDNKTGKTYSLAQFPYIYSVKGGVLKVHNLQANGYFDYYMPTKTASGITFTKIQLPTAEQFPIASRVRGFNIDKSGNIVIEVGVSTKYFPNLTFDAYGETKVGNIIISCISEQTLSSLQPGGLEYRRLMNAKRYHIADNGKIYRFNFKGNLNNISVEVLQNGSWFSLGGTETASFSGLSEGYIVYQAGPSVMNRDYFRVTKIDNGMVYYSTAAFSDRIIVYESLTYPDTNLHDYVGVVKIDAGGCDNANSHLAFLNSLTIDNTDSYRTFLLGETKMLYLTGDNTAQNNAGELHLYDVKTGQDKTLGYAIYIYNDGNESVYFENFGWISLCEDVDFATFSASNFSQNPVAVTAHLEAYYKLITA